MKRKNSKCISVLMSFVFALSSLLSMTVSVQADHTSIQYGTPISSDGPVLTEAFIERALVTYEDGKPVALVSVSGAEYSLVQIVDLNNESILHQFRLNYTGYCYWGVVTEEGIIYFTVGNKIVEYDPRVKQPVLIGTAPTYRSANITGVCWDSEEQMIYGGAPNTGNIFRCDPKTKEITVLACFAPEILSTNKPAVLGDFVYGGGSYALNDGSGTNLFKIDKHTGSIEAIPNPNGLSVNAVGQVYAGGIYIFAQLDGTAYIYDTEAEEWLDKTFQWRTQGLTDLFDNKYFFLQAGITHSIDVRTLEITDYPGLKYGTHLMGSGRFIELDNLELPGYSFISAQYNGNLYAFNLQTQTVKRLNVTLTGVPIQSRKASVGYDGRVYVTGFKGSKGAAWDPQTHAVEYFAAEQGEGICSDPATGKIYIGNYSGASIYEMDASRPYATKAGAIGSGANPISLGSIGDEQDRPFGLDVAQGKLVVGTLAGRGAVDGALSVIDLMTYEKAVYKNIIPHQSVLTVTHKGNIVYAGTTVTGGESSVPLTSTAHVFAFDLNTRSIIKDVEIKIDGINGSIGAVHGLKIGPDGMLYGAVAGADFVMNPDTLTVVRKNVYGTSFEVNLSANAQAWHEYKMEFDPQTGHLFRLGDIIDPETLQMVCARPDVGQFAGLDSKGNAYFVDGKTVVYKVPVIRTNITPDNPTPNDPGGPSQAANLCKWCDGRHDGFPQSIIGFWHTIFYFWAHLFGLK